MIKKWSFASPLVVALLLTHFTATPARSGELEFQYDLGAGYRIDDFDWNFAGNGVNVLSELTWRDLEIFQLVLGGRLLFKPGRDSGSQPQNPPESPARWRIYLRGNLGYGWIGDGTVRDSDFAGNDRTLEFSRSDNQAGDGNVLDASIGGGLQFRFRKDAWRIAPLIGLDYHEQELTISRGIQVVSRPDLAPPGNAPQPLGPLPPNLASTFQTEWQGFWIGVDLEILPPASRLEFFATAEFHWVMDYQAKADWNLRQDLAHPRSFEQHADEGWGVVLAGGTRLKLTPRLGLFLRAEFRDWQIEEGTQRIFFADGTGAVARLNNANWESASLLTGFEGRF